MAFAGSGMFTATLADILDNTTAIDLGSDSFKLALYNNSATPDFSVTSANTAYGAGVWATNEVTGTNWAAGGVALSGNALTANSPGAGQVKWDATDVSVASVTVSNAEGCLIYDDTIATPVADQGLLVIDFGAAYSATAGTFAITFDSNGICYFDVVP
jgi:hypothetical protein